jgi:phenylpyruvate tautomerase PptA (4-oxalocrotonate tautomerase family)
MPVLQVYYPQESLDSGRKATLAKRLTDVLLDMEGGAKTHGGLAFATVLFTPVAADDWWVGGRTDTTYVSPPGKFLARVTIPEGYMSQLHKSEVHSKVNAAIVDVMGSGEHAAQGANILVTIEEVTEGNWGARGATISMNSISDSVGLAKTSSRFQWVKAYFAAKARQFAAYGYPPDVGGLLPGDSATPAAAAMDKKS